MKLQPKKNANLGIFRNIPSLPVVVRYYDDYSDSYGVLKHLECGAWKVHYNGTTHTFRFVEIDDSLRNVAMVWCAFVLAEQTPATADKYLYQFKRTPADLIISLATSDSANLRAKWNLLHVREIGYDSFGAISSFLSFLCRFSIGDWEPSRLDLVSQLPYPKRDKYAGVRTGEVFLSIEEEAAIVRQIDEVCSQLGIQRMTMADSLLEDTAILVCSYQFGFRAKQIAMLEMRNIRIWSDGVEEHPAVHLTFSMIKQRSSKKVFPMLRRVKRDWAPIFAELYARAEHKGMAGADHIFHRTPEQVSTAIGNLTESLGCRRGTTEPRHSAAQRLVDAGASEEELASFMGHSDLNTGLIYFSSTPAQGARINQALGISKTYQTVMKIAHGRFITPEELAELKGDQQVGGVPHGIPIAGIGGCSSGQPNCPFNPIMSCYGCPRFMPVAIASIHHEVLEDLRGVIKFFYASSHAERGSPALQLERTISNVQAVLSELGEKPHELES
ncbi:MAG: hypothetical protein P4K83_05075 [Terracidiphilus sp.]|nr:hypothetical protein [Terracidiphilus sp.]